VTDRDVVRVVIADDHPVFRHGLAVLLGGHDGVEVVAEAGTGREAIDVSAVQLPDVIVMDIAMPDVDGLAATRQIVNAHPHVAVLVLSMSEDERSVFAAMRAGARGYLLKEAGYDEIVRAVLATANGELIFGARIAQQVLGFLVAESGIHRPVFPILTDREREVLELIAQGRSNAQIAGDLSETRKTVRNHAYNIFVKLQVGDRAEALVLARDAGLGRRGTGVPDG
jgi:DNA-binding NarL/FixJ family response regulator